MALQSAILVEISCAMGVPLPTGLKDIDALVKKTLLNEKVMNEVTEATRNYLIDCTKLVKQNRQVPLPSDLKEVVSPGRTPRVQEEEFNLDDVICDTNTKLKSVKTLIDDFEHGQIDIPVFQRKEIWGPSNKEMFLIGAIRGLPIHSITLAIEPDSTEKRFLLDGLQRLSTLRDFIKDQIEIEGFFFSEMPEKTKNKLLFKDVPISEVHTDRKNWPEIFRVINKSGVPLNDIELRRAVYHHPVIQRLEDITEKHTLWLEIVGAHKRYKGLSVLFRAVAMSYGYADYSKPMTKHLDRICSEWDRLPDSIDSEETFAHVDKILWAIRNSLKYMFKTNSSSQINQGLVDCIFHGGFHLLNSYPDISDDDLTEKLNYLSKKLQEDPKTYHALTRDTSGVEAVKTRMSATIEILKAMKEPVR